MRDSAGRLIAHRNVLRQSGARARACARACVRASSTDTAPDLALSASQLSDSLATFSTYTIGSTLSGSDVTTRVSWCGDLARLTHIYYSSTGTRKRRERETKRNLSSYVYAELLSLPVDYKNFFTKTYLLITYV